MHRPNLLKEFAELASGVKTPKNVYGVPSEMINNIFRPEPLLFRPAPDMHYPILRYLNMQDRSKGSAYTEQNPDIAKMYLTNPAQTISRADMGYSDDDRIPASPAIMYTQYRISKEREGFAVMLRDSLLSGDQHAQDRLGCIKLAIGGYFDDYGMFTFEKIMIPKDFIKFGSKNKRLQETPIHEDSVKGVLYYAALCTEQMFERQRFTPEYNFEQSREGLPADATINVQSYRP